MRMANAQNDMAGTQTEAEREIAQLIVSVLNLEVAPEEIEPDAPLFYDGLGLDSIDALEMAMELSKKYGIELRSDSPDNGKIFASLRSLTNHVAERSAE